MFWVGKSDNSHVLNFFFFLESSSYKRQEGISWPDLLLYLLNWQAPWDPLHNSCSLQQLFLSENWSQKLTSGNIILTADFDPLSLPPKQSPCSFWEHLESGRSLLKRLLGQPAQCVCVPEHGVHFYVYHNIQIMLRNRHEKYKRQNTLNFTFFSQKKASSFGDLPSLGHKPRDWCGNRHFSDMYPVGITTNSNTCGHSPWEGAMSVLHW